MSVRIFLRATIPGPGQNLHVYELPGAAAPVQMVGTVQKADSLDGALNLLLAPDFDPRTMAVLPGDGPGSEGAPGTVEIVAESAEELDLRVDSPAGGVVNTRRAFLGIWRAEVDGRPVEPQVANVHRLAVAKRLPANVLVTGTRKRGLAFPGEKTVPVHRERSSNRRPAS